MGTCILTRNGRKPSSIKVGQDCRISSLISAANCGSLCKSSYRIANVCVTCDILDLETLASRMPASSLFGIRTTSSSPRLTIVLSQPNFWTTPTVSSDRRMISPSWYILVPWIANDARNSPTNSFDAREKTSDATLESPKKLRKANPISTLRKSNMLTSVPK